MAYYADLTTWISINIDLATDRYDASGVTPNYQRNESFALNTRPIVHLPAVGVVER